MAKGIENRARSPPAVFDFATSQIQKHGGTKMYYDLVESGKRIKALRKEHGLTQEQDILGISRTSAYNLVKKKVFHSVRIGGSIRISKKSFDEWLDHQM